MLSRVANSVYWAARYIERAENTARWVDVNLQMSLDAPISFSDQWQPLVAITGELPAFLDRYEVATRERVLRYLTTDPLNPSSILSCLRQARENARSIREVLSSEMWEEINSFYLRVSEYAASDHASLDSHDFFNDVKLRSHLVAGVADNTMSHGEAWHFFQLGRLLERADNTSRLVDVKYFLLLPSTEDVGGPIDEMQWSILLRSASAFEMYRKRYGRIEPEAVVEFLLLDKEFPRATLYCLAHADESVRAISGSPAETVRNPVERLLGRLRSELAYAQASEIISSGLHEYCDRFQARLNEVGSAIARTFFAQQPIVEQPSTGTSESRANGDVLSGYQRQRWTGGNS
ncbi:MAG: alpha-E domain-containing protein [Dehalococcoidia bacterium]